jgi:general secretion pathway protein D
VRVTDEGIYLDFQETDLRLVLTALGEIGGLNLVYSELPSTEVTLRTAQPVAADDALDLLKSLAAANGLVVREENGLVQIADVGPDGLRPQDDEFLPELRIYVYRLKHARAPRLASTLQSLFGGTVAGAQNARRGPQTLSEQLRDQQIDLSRREDPTVRVELGPTGGEVSLPGQLTSEVQIVPDELTNSLLIRATPADWEIIETTIEALDLRPLQVLIEVLIAEIRRSDAFELGVSAEIVHTDDDLTVGASLESRTMGDFVLGVMSSGATELNIALSALAADGRASILSRPVILAQNNQEARFLVGSERPFVQVSRSLPTGVATRDQVVQYRDVGTSVTIIPTINADGYVNMEVIQQVSNATDETQFDAPIINTREAATHLFLRDGQTAVLGGLIERLEERSDTGIPLLKDIPVVGMLFGSTKRASVNNELFLFLTVHVIESDTDTEMFRRGVEEGSELLQEEMKNDRPLVPGRVEPAEPADQESGDE